MKKSELRKLIREEIKKYFPEIYSIGTKVSIGGKKGTITGNFMDRGDEYASYYVEFEDGSKREISTADSSLKVIKNYFDIITMDVPFNRSKQFQHFARSFKDEIDFERAIDSFLDAYEKDLNNISNWDANDFQDLMDYLDDVLTGRRGGI